MFIFDRQVGVCLLIATLPGQTASADVSILIETFLDYLLATMRLILPEPLYMNKSPEGMLNLRNASIHGLSYARRNCPIDLNVFSTDDSHHISGNFCLTFEDHFNISALIQITSLLYDSDFEPAVVHFHDLNVRVNLTLKIPKKYNAVGALVDLQGKPIIEMRGFNLTAVNGDNDDEVSDGFSILSTLGSVMSMGPLGGYIEFRMANSVQKAIKILNAKLQDKIDDVVNRG
ncbi:unnamed protein product [Mesocestoides corti]|uniref:BPI2 domain-containing protein n=1 Tax=Mesocestoides corti TaxID=53468 RepID=A0A0R3UP85_MESCO|nr:unnamed protein product [Mesocestoides corti]